MTSVPNWIPRAVIFDPDRYYSSAPVTPIVEWRATKTQVIVRTSPTGRERRFYLDSLTEVGQPKYFSDLRTRLEAPDAPVVLAAQRDQTIRTAKAHLSSIIEKQRLQDTTDAEATVKKLFAIRVAVDEAIAMAGEVL